MPVWLLPLIFQLIQSLPGLIRTAETAFSGVAGKSGSAKKQLVSQSVSTAIDVMATLGKTDVAAHKPAIMEAVSALTDATVKTMNAVNALKNPVENAGGPLE